MPDLTFRIEGAEAERFAAVPQITFKLRITNSDAGEMIHSVALRSQIQIEATRRRYSGDEQEKLGDLFGEPERWSRTLRPLLWTHVSVNVPPFEGTTVVDLPIPCTFDFNVAATKFFHALADGDVPLCLMFSGTVFYARGAAGLQVAPISWDKEAKFSLSAKVWRDMMDYHYPGSAWLCLRRDVFDRLHEYKVRHGLPTWEQALENILSAERVTS